MLDSINIALSGMLGHERGLNVIGNNVSNMNTLAFQGSTISFADVFLGSTPNGLGQQANGAQRGIGGGVDASRTQLDFRPGLPQTTGNALDVALQGEGFFIVQDESGAIRYTRAGSFEIVDDALVVRGQRLKVMTRNAGGELVPITLKDLHLNPAKATSEVVFEQQLSRSDAEHSIDSLTVFDKLGVKHTLRVVFNRDTSDSVPNGMVRWKVTVLEDGLELATDNLDFIGPQAVNGQLHLVVTLKDSEPQEITFDFGDVDNTDLGGSTDSPVQSTLAVRSQNGFATGTIAGETFDANGVLKISYTNGQKVDGPKLALAQITDRAGLLQVGNGLFEYRGAQTVNIREAGEGLQVQSQTLEGSNVDLTTQFSQLILMQRGYQASSQVLSTANDMLQELFDMRGRR